MSHRVTITGAPPFNDPSNPGAGPQPQPRRNIKDLIKDEKQFSLYIQALAHLQSQQNTDRTLNWFAISGIHGEPSSETWDNGGDKPADGYCAHGVPTFPTWHRPYVALFEQTLQAAALKIAQRYTTEREAWITAAQKLRAPFWDWADPDTYLPPKEVYDLVNFSTLNIKPTPNTTSPVKNPLTSYEFQTKIDWSEVGLNLPSDKTVRYPRSTPQQSVAAFESGVLSAFRRPGMAFELWKSLNWLDTWDAMSNGRVTQGGRANSLESLHGTVHVVTGRGGHMAEIAASGFDPLFWLHHTNVDRQLALWQALHPGQWITGQDLNADLHPFWKGQNDFHKSSSDTVTDQTRMGAIYPEFIGLEGLSPEARRAAIEKKVDALYDPQGTGVRKPRSGSSGSRAAPQAAPAQAQFSALRSSVAAAAENIAQAVTSSAPSVPSSDNEPLDWFIRVRVQKYQFKHSFEILFFLGDIPEDSDEWKTSETLIGVHGEFVNSRPDQCANCTRNADATVEGFIDLTHTLERAGYGERPDEATVENYLKENLSWRVQLTTGEVVDPKDVKRLEVSVMTIKLAEPEEVGELFRPLEGVKPVHRNITSHLPGGRVGHRDYEI